MPRIAVPVVWLLVSFLALSAPAGEIVTLMGEWPQFRGPARNGVSTDTGLLTKWDEGGPPLAWKTAGAGRGYASPAIAGGKVYTLGDGLSTAEDKDEYVTCFDEKDGKQLWIAKTGAPWTSGKPDWQSSRATPAVDGERVYVVTPQGLLACFETATGKEVWKKHLKDDLGGKKGDGWGYSESVLIDGDKLLCTPGGAKNTVVALDKKSGELLWSAPWSKDEGAGHSSMGVSEIEGTRVYVQTTSSGALGIRASDGKLLWTYPTAHCTAVIPSPIVRDNLVFVTSGYGRGGALIKQVAAGDGDIKVEEIYPLNPGLASKHGGVVLVGELLFGGLDDRNTPFCADLLTGKARWEKARGAGQGSVSTVAADGHLYQRYANGVVALVKADPEKYETVSMFTTPDSGARPSWSHPVVAGGKLYIREQDQIFCYDVKAK